MPATTPPRRRILIVDDDRALRHVLAALLTGAGHVVEQAGDGPDASPASTPAGSTSCCSTSTCPA